MSKEHQEESAQGFKIVDRRRFDSDGQAKATPISDPSTGQSRASTAAPEREGTAVDESLRPTDIESGEASYRAASENEAKELGHYPPLTFGAFIVSLATQAMWQLGAAPPPPGVDIRTDRAAAKQTIDLLALLQAKTRGNLEVDEDDQLEEILHSLRMIFVQR